MPYRSQRFPAQDMPGLEKVWTAIDEMEAAGMTVRDEIMAGTSYRRQLHARTLEGIGPVNYLLQAALEVPTPKEGHRITARYYIDESNRVLGGLDLPGEPKLDAGGLHGWDRLNSKQPFGIGKTEDEILHIFMPWVSTEWTDAGRRCMFYCGIVPPEPKAFMEDHHNTFNEKIARMGMVTFTPTPEGLQTH